MRTSPRLALAACLALAAIPFGGCDGQIMDPTGTAGGPGGPGGGGPGGPVGSGGGGLGDPSFHFQMTEPSGFPGIRMLTRDELRRTIADLTGVTPDTSELPEELKVLHLDNDAARSSIQDAQHMRRLLELATLVAAEAPIDEILPCTDGCSDADIRAFLQRAFADQPTTDEVGTYRGIHDAAAADGGGEHARRAVLQSALLSPRFLYRTELGDATGVLHPTELAKKLSYFLWGTRPDDELLGAALDGSLAQSATYRAQVDRLLADDRARERFTQLVFQWLGLDHFELSTRSLAADLPDGMQAHMEREVELLTLDVLFDRRAPLSELFRSESTFVNGPLATLYGIEGVEGTEFASVSLDGTDRRGILTTALVLSAHAKEDGRSPMQRGKFLVDELLCHSFPPEAGLAVMELPEGEYATFREKFEPLEQTQPCSNCHRVLNAGFALDVFDNVGARWPADEVALDEARGHFDLPPYDIIRFTTPVEAADGFATHPALAPCFVAQTYRFAMGRVPGSEDATAFRELLDAFEAADQDAVELLRAIALSERFRTAVTSP